MINRESFSEKHIREIQLNTKRDPVLIERVIFAFGLLESLTHSELPFIFKGGTSLLLLIDEPHRFSTDIDILVNAEVPFDTYLKKASSIWPFSRIEEQIRPKVSGIEKRHFKFFYISPLTGKEMHIILDVVFEENYYCKLVDRCIKNDLLITEEPYNIVSVPDINSILGDKLTAFAPNTTGIPYNAGKELEIIKQFFDVSILMDHSDSLSEVKKTYQAIAASEIKYRGLRISTDEILQDTMHTAYCIAGRGQLFTGEYNMLIKGINSIKNHIFDKKFSGETAALMACKVAWLAALMLTGKEAYPAVMDGSHYMSEIITESEHKKLNYIKKIDLKAYGYLIEAMAMLRNG